MFGISSRFNASPPQTQLLATRTRRTAGVGRSLECVSGESHPRQWVDRSSPAYKRRRLDRFFESQPREWVDRSSPAYKESRRQPLFLSSLCRPYLNNPPTAVRGISAACISRSVLGVVPRLSLALNSLGEEARGAAPIRQVSYESAVIHRSTLRSQREIPARV